MPSSTRADWLIPGGLIALSVVPMVAGSIRLAQIGGGAAITPENARFFADPLPVFLHIISAIIFSVLGAFQFAPGLRRRQPKLHRVGGRIVVSCGFVTALSGLWMTWFYPYVGFDGAYLYVIRLLVGLAMALSLWLGVAAIRRHDIAGHQAWMMRGYALGLGAGDAGFYPPPRGPLPWYPGGIGQDTLHGSRMGHKPCNSRMVDFASAPASAPSPSALFLKALVLEFTQ